MHDPHKPESEMFLNVTGHNKEVFELRMLKKNPSLSLGLLRMGRQTAPHRSGVGASLPFRQRGPTLSLGQQVDPQQPVLRQRLDWSFPVDQRW